MTDLTALADLLKPTIRRVWDAIGSDVLATATEVGEIDDQIAIEMCVDSDNLRAYGGPEGAEADRLIDVAQSESGWDAVIEALLSEITLI